MFMVLGKIFAILLPFIIGFVIGHITAKHTEDNSKNDIKQYKKFFTYKDKAFWMFSEDYEKFENTKYFSEIKSKIVLVYNDALEYESYNILVIISHNKLTFHELMMEDLNQ